MFSLIQEGIKNPAGLMAVRQLSFGDFAKNLSAVNGIDLNGPVTLDGITLVNVKAKADALTRGMPDEGNINIGSYLDKFGTDPRKLTEAQVATSIALIPDFLNHTGIFAALPLGGHNHGALGLDDQTATAGSTASDTPTSDPQTPVAAAVAGGGKWSPAACNAVTAANGISNIGWMLTAVSGVATGVLSNIGHAMTSKIGIATGAIGVVAGATGTAGWLSGIYAKCTGD